jgi:hypothetical protein
MQLELLLKISSMIDDSLPLTAMGFRWQTKGNYTIMNQLDARVDHCESHEVYYYGMLAFL